MVFFFSHCAKLSRKAAAFFHHQRSQIAIGDELFLYTKVIQYFFGLHTRLFDHHHVVFLLSSCLTSLSICSRDSRDEHFDNQLGILVLDLNFRDSRSFACLFLDFAARFPSGQGIHEQPQHCRKVLFSQLLPH